LILYQDFKTRLAGNKLLTNVFWTIFGD